MKRYQPVGVELHVRLFIQRQDVEFAFGGLQHALRDFSNMPLNGCGSM